MGAVEVTERLVRKLDALGVRMSEGRVLGARRDGGLVLEWVGAGDTMVTVSVSAEGGIRMLQLPADDDREDDGVAATAEDIAEAVRALPV